ncbi:SCP2 sterol-binding domain-containing protein [Micromonospora sp. CPCC 206060]|uniref:SCP2 sterol-binding domain-containing protein n=1 Tax=Micromonospora sp. CPCC 206060 TaxID=3122406 RepID=UPI002FF044DC
MGEATTRFFEDLDRRGYEPRLEKAAGTVRFDFREDAHTDHWLVLIDHGTLKVTRAEHEADTVISTSPELFDDIAVGREHVIAALLRGDLTVTGNALLVLQIERIFPGSPDARGPRRDFVKEAC